MTVTGMCVPIPPVWPIFCLLSKSSGFSRHHRFPTEGWWGFTANESPPMSVCLQQSKWDYTFWSLSSLRFWTNLLGEQIHHCQFHAVIHISEHIIGWTYWKSRLFNERVGVLSLDWLRKALGNKLTQKQSRTQTRSWMWMCWLTTFFFAS